VELGGRMKRRKSKITKLHIGVLPVSKSQKMDLLFELSSLPAMLSSSKSIITLS
jgi:hypothetical protein